MGTNFGTKHLFGVRHLQERTWGHEETWGHLPVCAQHTQVRPYLVGEAVGTRGLEVQVGLEELQEAAVDLLQKGHFWGYPRTHLGLSQDIFGVILGHLPASLCIPAWKSFSKTHGSISRCSEGWQSHPVPFPKIVPPFPSLGQKNPPPKK